MKKLVAAAALAAGLVAAPVAQAITLEPLGRTSALGEAQAEIAAFHPETQRTFVTNSKENRLDIYDFADPADPVLIASVDLSSYGAGPNSVDVSRKGLVAVAVEADPTADPGSVELFDTDGEHLASLPAGALPDMVTFAEKDRYLLAANEGEAESNDADPEGSVTVIRLAKDVAESTVKAASFEGVPRFGSPRIACPGTPFANDAEPEYIAPGAFGTALVTLQENNAVALLDIDRGRFLYVRGLGYKGHGKERNALDPSDRDGAIAINPWDRLYGMFQPDAISAYTHRGLTYYVTANEGDARDRDGCEEEERVGGLTLDPDVFPDAAAIQEDAALGRLNVTSTMGDRDGDGDFDRLFSFGARSFSILGPLGGLLYDSGAELEKIAGAEEPTIFNASNEEPAVFDDRSDNKGPEPEGVDVGSVGRSTYAFVASERQGGLYAYRLNGPSASFVDYLNTRPADLGPEGVRFVPREDSPTDHALVLVTNEISGTVAVIEVRP
jgi:hypothetical protein